MSELIQMMGTVAILLTGVGSYRLFTFFFSDDMLFPGLLAMGITVAFIGAFEYITLLLGIGVLFLPFIVAYRYRDRIPVDDFGLSDLSQSNKSDRSTTQSSSTAQVQCSSCGELNDPTRRHCGNCSELLIEDNT